jgi:transposase
MIDPEKRKAIFLLHQEGMGQREIARRFEVSRNTVRQIIAEEGVMPEVVRRDKVQIDRELLEKLYEECEGWKQRMHEKLEEEKGIKVKYSTLTRVVRELGIGSTESSRCDRVPDKPGEEMQHDTTVYKRIVGGKRMRVIASLLYLRYSKRRYLKFYRSFNRFKMKCFFHEALTYWGYAAPECIIDNTNLARLRGTGKDAVIVPEMESFSKQYGFKFICHAKGHANRKAGEERSFRTVQTNFFPGRTFADLEDMNRQAFEWATVRMENRPVAEIGLIPAKAFEHEKLYLNKLPPYLPAPYRVHKRDTDQYGYVSFDGNYFWMPGTERYEVKVLEYSDCLKVYKGRKLVAEYELPPDGVKKKRFSPEGFPKPRYRPKNRKKPTAEEEKRLRAMGEVVSAYLDFALKPKGIERHRFVRALFGLAQKMSSALFHRTIERALKYQITEIETVERIAVLAMGEGIEPLLGSVEVDESFREREAYVEGHLSEEPDFSPYDELLEEDDG